MLASVYNILSCYVAPTLTTHLVFDPVTSIDPTISKVIASFSTSPFPVVNICPQYVVMLLTLKVQLKLGDRKINYSGT